MNKTEFKNNYIKKCTTNRRLDSDKVTEVVGSFYRIFGYSPPKSVRLVKDPWDLQYEGQKLTGVKKYNRVISIAGEKSNFLSAIEWIKTTNQDYYGQFVSKIGDENIRKCDIMSDMIECGIWQIMMLDDACLVCPIPDAKFANGKLHSASGMAVSWPDSDHGMYFIHGTRFKDENTYWDIVKRKMSTREILSLQNIEQRRVAINHYGWDAVFESLDKTHLDTYVRRFRTIPEGGFLRVNDGEDSDTDVRYDLYRVVNIVPDIDILVVTYTDPSTGRFYVDTVPDTNPHDDDMVIEKAYDAMAWKFQMTRDEYLNELRLES